MTSRQAGAGDGPGIWSFAHLYEPSVDAPHRVSLGEGWTPLVPMPALAEHLGVAEIRLKRDDLSPGGSHKARSLAYRVSLARQRGEPALCISSSGNAAVAASLYCAHAGLRLFAFVSPATSPVKMAALARAGTIVVQSARPRNLARYASRLFGVPNVTPSLDEASIEGFKSMGGEVLEQSGTLPDAVFSFVTSGSSMVGMARALADAGRSPALHAVQAGSHAAIAGAGAADPRFVAEQSQPPGVAPSRLAGLLAVDDTPRAEEARRVVAESGGRGWVQHDDEIVDAADRLRSLGVDTSPEGAACVSAVRRARSEGVLGPSSRVVVILTGHGSQWPSDAPVPTGGETHACGGYAEVRALLGHWLPEVARSER